SWRRSAGGNPTAPCSRSWHICSTTSPSTRSAAPRSCGGWIATIWTDPAAACLPLGDRAVAVPPDRRAPAMAGGGGAAHCRLVHLDAEAGAGGDQQLPVLEGEAVPGQRVVAQIALRVVVDAEALLLDEGVVADGVDLQAGGQRDGAERAMGRQRHATGSGPMADAHHFRDAADMGGIGIDHLRGARFEHRLEIVAAV